MNKFIITDLGDLISVEDLSAVVVKGIALDESDTGELLPPEEQRTVYVAVASFRSRTPDLVVGNDRDVPEQAIADIAVLYERIRI